MVEVIQNILSEQSLNNIEEYWASDDERVLTDSIQGKKRDIKLVEGDIIKELTGSDLDRYEVHSCFFAIAGEPFKVHCDLGKNPITHNLCINLLQDDQLNDQCIVILKQLTKTHGLFESRASNRIILVDDDTPESILETYQKVKYHPVYASTLHEHVDKISQDLKITDEQKKHMSHVWQETLPYLDIDKVIYHKYNQGILFDSRHLHCGGSAQGDHKRCVLYVRLKDE